MTWYSEDNLDKELFDSLKAQFDVCDGIEPERLIGDGDSVILVHNGVICWNSQNGPSYTFDASDELRAGVVKQYCDWQNEHDEREAAQ